MNTKSDPYATKLHKRIDVLLLLFIVLVIALLLGPIAKGGTHLAMAVVRPFWTTLALFTSGGSGPVHGVQIPMQGEYDGAGAADRVALAALFSAPSSSSSFSPMMVVEERKSRHVVAGPTSDLRPQFTRRGGTSDLRTPSSLSSQTQISGVGSTVVGSGEAGNSRTGYSLAGNDARETSSPVSSAIDTAPRYARESNALLSPSSVAAAVQSSQGIADTTVSSSSFHAESAPFAPAASASSSLAPFTLKAPTETLTRSIRIEPLASGQQGWDGGDGNGSWSNNNNWGNNSQPNYGTLFFDDSNNGQTTMTDDNITAMNGLNWSGTNSWTLNQGGSTVLSLYDSGGAQAKIENGSTGLVTINLPITFAANNGGPPNPFGEINAVSGDITFGTGTLTVNGSSVNGIKLFGSNHTTTFNNTVSASGKWFGLTGATTTMAVGGAFTSGDIYVMNGGTLKLNSGGSITTSALRLGGDFGNTGNQNQTLGGTFALTNAAGGQSFSSTINTVSGNTSGSLLIDSQNTSGTNTISSGIFLDSNLNTTVAAGGTLEFSGAISFQNVASRSLNIAGAGTTVLSGSATNVLNGTDVISKTGAGTLKLDTTWSGAALLKYNLNGGTLALTATSNITTNPGVAYPDKIELLGNSTIQALNTLTVGSFASPTNNSGVKINGNTLTFDVASGANTATVDGVISGSGGALNKTGAGTLLLTQANTYSGATTVAASGGTLNASVASALGGTSGITVNSGGTLLLSGSTGVTDRINDAATVTLAGGTLNAGGLSEGAAGTVGIGALTLTSSSVIDLLSTSLLHFANSNASWNGTLSIWNWSGTPVTGGGLEQILFGTNTSGLNAGQLTQVSFFSGAGTGLISNYAMILSSGEIVPGMMTPVPEPSTWMAAALALLAVGYTQRRRFRKAALITNPQNDGFAVANNN